MEDDIDILFCVDFSFEESIYPLIRYKSKS